jgi:hypothetical protein
MTTACEPEAPLSDTPSRSIGSECPFTIWKPYAGKNLSALLNFAAPSEFVFAPLPFVLLSQRQRLM